jgi:hypothetical protein
MDKVTKKYLVRREIVQEVELDPAELMTIAEAAREAGLDTKTIANHVSMGNLTAYEDPDAPPRQRARLILRSEFEAWMQKREQESEATWAPRLGLDSCKVCGTTERPHFARGMCVPCYKRDWWRRKREAAAEETGESG